MNFPTKDFHIAYTIMHQLNDYLVADLSDGNIGGGGRGWCKGVGLNIKQKEITIVI